MLANVLAFLGGILESLFIHLVSRESGKRAAEKEDLEEVIQNVEKGNNAISRARDNPDISDKLHDKYLK